MKPEFYDIDKHRNHPKFETNEDCSTIGLLRKGKGPYDSGSIFSTCGGKLCNLDWYYSVAVTARTM